MANSPVSCAGGPGSSPGPATKYLYAYRHKRTRLWWAGLKQEDTDDLRRAALFPNRNYTKKLSPDLWYEPVKLVVTIQEVPV